MEIQAKVLRPGAVVPRYANEGDAGCDLVAISDCTLAAGGGRALVGTGMSIAIPEGYAGFVVPRSGLAAQHGVTCVNAPGIIDAGYRGELLVALINHDPTREYVIRAGDRIAQLVLVPVAAAVFCVVEELPAADRGAGGFGSTGR